MSETKPHIRRMYEKTGRNLVMEEELLRWAIEESKDEEDIQNRKEEIMKGLDREWVGFRTDPAADEMIPTCGFWRILREEEYR